VRQRREIGFQPRSPGFQGNHTFGKGFAVQELSVQSDRSKGFVSEFPRAIFHFADGYLRQDFLSIPEKTFFAENPQFSTGIQGNGFIVHVFQPVDTEKQVFGTSGGCARTSQRIHFRQIQTDTCLGNRSLAFFCSEHSSQECPHGGTRGNQAWIHIIGCVGNRRCNGDRFFIGLSAFLGLNARKYQNQQQNNGPNFQQAKIVIISLPHVSPP